MTLKIVIVNQIYIYWYYQYIQPYWTILSIYYVGSRLAGSIFDNIVSLKMRIVILVMKNSIYNLNLTKQFFNI